MAVDKNMTFGQFVLWSMENDKLTDDEKTAMGLYIDGAEYENLPDTTQKIYDRLQLEYKEYSGGKPPVFEEPALVDEETFVTLGPDGQDVPKVNLTTGDGNADVVVNTQALQAFSDSVLQLETLVNEALNSLNLVHVKPGMFGAGLKLGQTIQGSDRESGLVGDTRAFLHAVLNTFWALRANIGMMKIEYDTTESWNELTVANLDKVFNSAWSHYEQIFDTGSASSGNNGAVGGGGNGQNTPTPSPSLSA